MPAEEEDKTEMRKTESKHEHGESHKQIFGPPAFNRSFLTWRVKVGVCVQTELCSERVKVSKRTFNKSSVSRRTEMLKKA